MKKKLLAAMLCVAMAATSLVGCGGSGDSGKDTDTAKSSEKGSDEEKVELTI